jgi:hypothetical protein
VEIRGNYPRSNRIPTTCVLALRVRSWRGNVDRPSEAEDQDVAIGRTRVVSMHRSELSTD